VVKEEIEGKELIRVRLGEGFEASDGEDRGGDWYKRLVQGGELGDFEAAES
jgi:hypothetical protein